MTRILGSILVAVGVLLSALSSVTAVRNLRIASPLQALTIWDREPVTPRSKFLPRFKAGLQAEANVRQALSSSQQQDSTTSTANGEDWAQQAATADRNRQSRVERAAARAFEQAFAKADALVEKDDNQQTKPRSNKYQFVGVINAPKSAQPITWYARPKPADSAWSVRLVHVNRQAILYDMFRRGKVDIFAKYKNRGQKVVTEEGVATRQPVIQAKYVVRERSWK